MQKVINCPCGFIVKAENDEELVSKAQLHAKEVHQMELSREQALSMARPNSEFPRSPFEGGVYVPLALLALLFSLSE